MDDYADDTERLERLEPCDVCKMSMRDDTEQRRLRRLRAHSRVHVVLHVVCLDLGFDVVIGVGRLNVQQVDRQCFTTHTQYQVQSSFLRDVVVRLCPVIVHLVCIPNSCALHIEKMSLLRCCLYSLGRFLNVQLGRGSVF